MEGKEIKKVEAEVAIEKINEEAYLREKHKEEYNNYAHRVEIAEKGMYYKTEGRARKVWAVVIWYNLDMPDFTYFVDITTGEIIGGQLYSSLLREQQLREDPNNVIEK